HFCPVTVPSPTTISTLSLHDALPIYFDLTAACGDFSRQHLELTARSLRELSLTVHNRCSRSDAKLLLDGLRHLLLLISDLLERNLEVLPQGGDLALQLLLRRTHLFGRVEDWRHTRASWFPAPASTNPACGFPALGFPVCFSSRVMRLLRAGRLSAIGPIYDPVVVKQSECVVEPLTTPSLPAEASAPSGSHQMPPNPLLHPALNVRKAPARVPHRKVAHPPP